MNRLLIVFTILIVCTSCQKLNEIDQQPELGPLEDGFKTSAAIGYCASLATRAFKGEPLPSNVTFSKNSREGFTGSGILYVNISEDNPLPFNSNTGDIIIAGLWNEEQGGVISIVFADIDLLSAEYKFYGIHTVPVLENPESGATITVFAEQDIIIGEGSDTLLNLSLSNPQFNLEMERLNTEHPTDVFAAVKQNVWHITANRNATSDVYDDSYKISGGGQIVEAGSRSGGILYHAMINTEFSYAECPKNPVAGTAFIQNIKAGEAIDLGGILLQFHDTCDGRSRVQLATGKYVAANGKNIVLGWN